MTIESPAVEPQPAGPVAASLSQPLYGATMGEAVARFFRKYATFSGRASRSEFWWVYLVYLVVSAAVAIALSAAGVTRVAVTADGELVYAPGYWITWIIDMILSLALLVPWLAIMWRRLHDTNRSGRYYFLVLIPLVGPLVLLVLLALRSDPAGARRFDR